MLGLIDWCLMLTFAVFQLFCSLINTGTLLDSLDLFTTKKKVQLDWTDYQL